MRVGLVCPYDLSKPGGVQAQVIGLSRSLSSRGDDPVLIAPGLPEDLDGIDLGPTMTVPGNRSKVPLSTDPRVGRVIKRATADLDLIHVHEPFMPMVSWSALHAGRPVVATFHAAPGAVGAGLYKIVRSQLKRLLGPNVKMVTAVSSAAAAPLPADLEVTIIPNGVDVASFQTDTRRRRGRVAFLGRDEKRKGLDILLRAWDQVVSTHPDTELVVMGADRQTGGVTWMGRIDDRTKIDVLASSAVCVAPNIGGESFGIVLVEAMAAGAAVIASDLDSFREVGGEAIVYFETGDSDDLARRLVGLLDDPHEIEQLGEAGRGRAGQFDWEIVATRYRDVYEQALS